MSRRLERVAGELRAEISRLLRREATDPRIRLVTITRVDVSPDLRHCIVFWSRLEAEGAPELEAVAEGLASASGFLRRRLARELPLKRMPALQFRYDPSLAQGDETLALIGSLHDEPEE